MIPVNYDREKWGMGLRKLYLDEETAGWSCWRHLRSLKMALREGFAGLWRIWKLTLLLGWLHALGVIVFWVWFFLYLKVFIFCLMVFNIRRSTTSFHLWEYHLLLDSNRSHYLQTWSLSNVSLQAIVRIFFAEMWNDQAFFFLKSFNIYLLIFLHWRLHFCLYDKSQLVGGLLFTCLASFSYTSTYTNVIQNSLCCFTL